MARIVAIVVLAALAAMPAAALGAPRGGRGAQQQQQQAPAAEQPLLQDTVPPEGPAPVQQAPASQTEADSGSIGPSELMLIAVGIAALLGGIWFVIARDARRATAGRVRAADGEPAGARGGSATRAGHRSRRLSAQERKRRKRGRAR